MWHIRFLHGHRSRTQNKPGERGRRGRGRKLAIGGQGLLSESVRSELGSCCIKKFARTHARTHAVPQAKLSPLGVPKTSNTSFLTCENLRACVLGCDGGLISLFFLFSFFWGTGGGLSSSMQQQQGWWWCKCRSSLKTVSRFRINCVAAG